MLSIEFSVIYNLLKGFVEEMERYPFIAPFVKKIISIGPNHFGTSIFVNNIKNMDYQFEFTSKWNEYLERYILHYSRPSSRRSSVQSENEEEKEEPMKNENWMNDVSSEEVKKLLLQWYEKSIAYGWEAAVENGMELRGVVMI